MVEGLFVSAGKGRFDDKGVISSGKHRTDNGKGIRRRHKPNWTHHIQDNSISNDINISSMEDLMDFLSSTPAEPATHRDYLVR
ncbi:UNVERIFIED_CONTAM: hypothetical protein PYX00_009761 [Menopon gallinae]|uniref:Uncharacterized protein n=1 Tax=Menopon gallinae TaxID=328185 RepID=A0AAW2HC63_9NEOP